MEILTVRDAAELLEVDSKTIYRLIERDGLPAFKIGRQWRMRLRDLEAWIDDRLRIREPAGTYALRQQQLISTAAAGQTEDGARAGGFSDSAFSQNQGLPIHRWVPWVAGFSATFVGEAFDKYCSEMVGDRRPVVLDPFAGVATTLVVGLLRGYEGHGFEINPYAAEAARLKLAVHEIPADELELAISDFMDKVGRAVRSGKEPAARPPSGFKTRRRFFPAEVARKVLLVKDYIETVDGLLVKGCFRIALASELVGFSNYSYEPSLGTRVAARKQEISDAPVVRVIVGKLREMLADIRLVQGAVPPQGSLPRVEFQEGDFFSLQGKVRDSSVDLVVTSPPYLNNYHYIRNSRPQAYWLDLVRDSGELKGVERASFGKYWQTVRNEDPIALDFPLPDLEDTLVFLRSINTHKKPYGGPGWANYAATYFNDCRRFAQVLLRLLRCGGRAVVVLGNSILQGVEFRTDELFAQVCELEGLSVEDILPLREKRTGTSIIRSAVRGN
ncbi:MAG: helix-turn-helix domain-containing protein, partial [Planctomycetota bacterium]